MSQSVKSIDLPEKTTLFSAAATVAAPGSIIHISGQVGQTKDGKVPPCYESQIHLALFQLRRVIAAAGGQVADICKMTVHIVDYSPENHMHERHLYRFLDPHRPAITIIPVARLARPECLIEIEAVLSISTSLRSSLAVSGPTFNAVTEGDYDVIVVGAGLSGLAAARDVMKAGLSCLVLEARDRVGGKTLSRQMKSGGVAELGAAWMNNTTEIRMTALAKRYGAEMIEQNTNGNGVLQDRDGICRVFQYGEIPPFDEETRQHLDDITHKVEADCQKVDTWNPKDTDLDSLTLTSYLHRIGASPLAIETSGSWIRAMMGQEPSDVSALYFLNYCKSFGGLMQLRSDEKDGGQYIRLKGGVQSICRGLASEFPDKAIRLGEPVYSLHQNPHTNTVLVTTPNGVLKTRKVIVSLPSAALSTISFDPPLPAPKLLLSNSFIYGYYNKVTLAFKSPFWIPLGFCGLAQSFLGPAGILRDVSDPIDGHWMLVCFLAGDNGRAWARRPPHERREALLAQVAALFSVDRKVIDGEFLESVEHDWFVEKYSGWGCPAAALPPGVLDAVGGALRAPVGDVHFVGHETAGEFKGFMEGAVRSGERGAAEVVRAFALRGAAKL